MSEKLVVELRPAVDAGVLRAGLVELAASDRVKDTVLHLIERQAVLLSAEAGSPGVAADEAKALARAAGELRAFYSDLLGLFEVVKKGDAKQLERALA